MIKEHSSVILNKDLADASLHKGDVGIVVYVHRDGKAYEVEFLTISGETVAIKTLEASMIQAVGPKMIPHAREMAV